MVKDTFTQNQIFGAVIQVLESIELVETSKKNEIVFRRFNFFLERIKVLENFYSNPDYNEFVHDGIKHYFLSYPNRELSEIAKAVIERPHIVFYNELYCISLYNLLGRQFSDFVDVYRTLKSESAKNKRKEKLIESIAEVKFEINSRCSEARSFEKMKEATNMLEKIIIERNNFDDLELIRS